MSSGKPKTMPMQIFWGVEAVYYGIVQVENCYLMIISQYLQPVRVAGSQ